MKLPKHVKDISFCSLYNLLIFSVAVASVAAAAAAAALADVFAAAAAASAAIAAIAAKCIGEYIVCDPALDRGQLEAWERLSQF